MTFRVPEQHRAGFEKLALITEAEFNDFLSSIKELVPGFHSPQISIKAFNKSELDAEDAQMILDSIVSFFAAKDNFFDDDQDEIDSSFGIDTIAESVFLGQENPDKLIEVFRERLLLIIEHGESIDISIKSVKAALENERLMTDVNITTDIRPIFSNGKTYHFNKAIIVHSLKIEYKDLEATKEIFITLDFNDLQILREAIEEAEAKELSLESYLKDSRVLLVSDRLSSTTED